MVSHMETETTRLLADDLFAGAGGWDLAADWLDVHARGVENMPQARATRDAAGLTTIHDDVWTFEPDGKATGLIASPPCQTFSQAGKGSGRKALDQVLSLARSLDVFRVDRLRERAAELGDDRTGLVLAPLHFALTNPAYEWLAWEQVPTVLPVWEACAERLRAHGWSVWTGILNAEQYGVPQTRRRAFLIASRDHDVTAPTPTHSRYYSRSPEKLDDGVAKWVSMAEALGTDRELARASGAGRGAQGTRMPTEPAFTILGASGGGSVRYRWRLVSDYGSGGDPAHRGERREDQPAPTITSKHNRNKWRATAEDSAPMTVAEATILQSFPNDYPWQGGKVASQLQVGNAVPPLLAEAALCAAMGEPYLPPTPEPITEPAQPALAYA